MTADSGSATQDSSLQANLRTRAASADVPHDIKGIVHLSWMGGELLLEAADGKVVVVDPSALRAGDEQHGRCHQEVDLRVILADENTLKHLLSGTLSLPQAYQSGQFRADGYIVWAFAIMRALTTPKA